MPTAGTRKAHSDPPGEDAVRETKRHLNWPEDKEFYVPDEVLAHYRKAIDRGEQDENEWNDLVKAFAAKHEDLGKLWQQTISGELPEDYDAGVLRPFVDSMAQEVARALQFFFTSTPHNRVDHIMVAGGSASLPGLCEAITANTSFACMLADPFSNMEFGDAVREKKVRREAPSYLTSCGLAMRRFLQ